MALFETYKEGKFTSENEEIEKRVRIERNSYRIDIGAYGSICVEAPTKDECLELFKEVTITRRDSRLKEAIR